MGIKDIDIKENFGKIVQNMDLKFRKIDDKELLIAIAIDKYKNVLMTAFMDKESLKMTLKTGLMHYFSTSRNKIWMKGEESKNVQKVLEVFKDCDGDALLFIVEQTGWACHEGYMSCFHNKVDLNTGNSTVIGDKLD
ncbi:phosphoribosyl-AMP cyclohydrolase [Methanococcus vannielii SB]|jgi:phosphoribosyl-AMP cyclohydrolase|uniref:Phosphoribosyl-AMP cyclohydrolase n=2 Tax=Methanococcus vannielii TaxID=2187 RepID=HIS3_METVS|nr:phosphoribosyl-AMP cyclohydrolase [Methanococcus vannielii]A6URR6.1 RecName: Full=Phosphoribosyl-AMP cyclohydrolase; Short=PRA-CH [Methanococcus vannielii SB]Q50837.1 RecName: Full=Phosphoribosyl-AMP cyclohydrolase; Short=PRA-CH [Methanococcus vannielii]ABR55188.1 phosphoribosyl-AMP cyclohydrolase [Methanococcus vannielii SB]CAA27649.1 phosphoribosyl-AMP cyclohydrolase [Methanococcus vannielii]